MSEWEDISTAPKDGTEIIGWRKDCGFILIRYTCLDDFLTDKEKEAYDEETCAKEDWFFADFIQGGRLEGDEIPTHWMLPSPPTSEKEGGG